MKDFGFGSQSNARHVILLNYSLVTMEKSELAAVNKRTTTHTTEDNEEMGTMAFVFCFFRFLFSPLSLSFSLWRTKMVPSLKANLGEKSVAAVT